MVTDGDGKLTAEESSATATRRPEAGAALSIVTVTVELVPPVTVIGNAEMLTSVGGAIVSGAETVVPASVALILAVDVVETVNVPVVWPSAIVTMAGTGTVAAALSLAMDSVMPPACAALAIVTVATLDTPPATALGESEIPTSCEGAGVIVNGADST
jgi:hypothetical protein